MLLVGIDGATFRVIDRLVERGRVPNLARLAREGTRGVLRSHQPLWSPRIWSSIATGKNPEKHGVLGFARGGQLYRSSDRKTHALWNIASDAGLTVGVVNWWTTYPPERIRGIMISDHVLPGVTYDRRVAYRAKAGDDATPIVFPADLSERTREWMSQEDSPIDVVDPFEHNDALPHWTKSSSLSRIFDDDVRVAKLALAVDGRITPDLLMVFFPGIDRVSHWLWGNLEPPERYPPRLRPTPDERRAGAKALFDYYAFTDALIGALLARFDERDLALVVSDHGFEGGVVLGSLTGAHASKAALHGVFYARGPGIAPGSAARGRGGPLSVNDITPSILAWLGLPLGEDMDGSPLPDIASGPVRSIPTHDTSPIERLGSGTSGSEAEMLDRLRKLGYIE